MLDSSDLTPFANLTDDQARIVIDDVEAELARIVPTLTDTTSPQVIRILRAAALRYFEYLQAGGRRLTVRERARGPFTTRDEMTRSAGDADIFTVSEIEKLNAAADITPATPLIAAPIGSFPDSDLDRVFR